MSRAAPRVVPIDSARRTEDAEETLAFDLDSLDELAGIDGVAAGLALLAARTAGLPRTIGARRPSRAHAIARGVRILETALALLRAMVERAEAADAPTRRSRTA